MSTSLLHSINAVFKNNLETKVENETIENKNSKYVIIAIFQISIFKLYIFLIIQTVLIFILIKMKGLKIIRIYIK